MASFCGLLFLALSTFLLYNFYYSMFDGSYFTKVRDCTNHNFIVCIISPGSVSNLTSNGISNTTGSSSDDVTSTETIPTSEDNAMTPEDENLPSDLDELKIESNGNLTLLRRLIGKIYPRFGRGQATQTTLEQQSTFDVYSE